MLAFQQYQAAFTGHIRNPKKNQKPAHVNDKRMAVYREIVFNNFYGSVSACFPVLHNILGIRRFKQLVRKCFFHQQFNSPFFREIPKTLVDFLASFDLKNHGLPIFTAQLAHYEWAELYVSTLKTQAIPPEQLDENLGENILEKSLSLNPAHLLVNYDFPVHMLSKKHQPVEQIPTFLLLFRNAEFEVKFMQLNPLTFELLQIIEAQSCTGQQALQQLAEKMQHPQPDTIVAFGQQILEDLLKQSAIVAQH
jgi:uncharacterized protein